MGMESQRKDGAAGADAKGQKVVKLIREIMVAARLCGPDPAANPRLAAAVEKTRKASVRGETIERAIRRGSGQADAEEGADYELVTFAGFAPHRVPVVVECLTEDPRRTTAEIRELFAAGSLGLPRTIDSFFHRLGVVEAVHADPHRDAREEAARADVRAIEPLAAREIPAGWSGARFLTEIDDIHVVTRVLRAGGWNVLVSEVRYRPRDPVELDEPARCHVLEFLGALDGHAEVHRVYAALK